MRKIIINTILLLAYPTLILYPHNQIVDEKISAIFKFGGLESTAQYQLNKPADFIITEKNEIILCDRDDNRIVFLTERGDLLNIFGRFGQGPSEFNRPSKLGILSDNLVVFDDQNLRIQIITMDGECLKTYAAKPMLDGGKRIWFSKNGSYYFNTVGYLSEHLVIHCSFDGDELGGFGEIFGEKNSIIRFDTDMVKKGKIPNLYKNKVFPVLGKNGSVFFIYCALPILKKFKANGNLIWKKRLSFPEIDIIRTNWVRANKKAPPNVAIRLEYWRDVVINIEGDLFLLANDPEKMILYRIDSNGNVIKRYIGVNDSIGMICIREKELWAFGVNSHIFYKFMID